ncbi:MAG: cytidylate kinase-like family protein [Balneolales bacterium]
MNSNLIQKIDRDIAAQLSVLGIGEKKPQKYLFPSITLSREYGCEGIPVARLLAKKLSTDEYPWVVFHRDLITKLSDINDIQKDLIDSLSAENRGLLHQYIEHLLAHRPTNVQLYKKIAGTLRILCAHGRTIILGSGGAILAADIKHILHVRLRANKDFKVSRVAKLLNVSKSDAENQIRSIDAHRENFIYEFTHKDVGDPRYYHLIIDNGHFNTEQIVELIHRSLMLKNLLPKV